MSSNKPDGDMLPAAKDSAVALPCLAGLTPPPQRIGVIAHCYYVDFAATLLQVMARMPTDAQLIVTTDSEAKAEQLGKDLAPLAPRLDIRVTENRGRDIAPRLIACRDVYSRFDLVLLIHSKKSLHTGRLAGWGEYLVRQLAGSDEVVRSIRCLFAASPDLGMIGPQHFEEMRDWCIWGPSESDCTVLGRRLGLFVKGYSLLDFPSGSMLWARPQALKALFGLNLDWSEFPDEAGQISGTIAHALERMFYFSCEMSGFRWLKVCHREDLAESGGLVNVNSFGDVKTFVAKRATQLVPPWMPRRDGLRATRIRPGLFWLLIKAAMAKRLGRTPSP